MSSVSDTTIERVKFETWFTPWNGSCGCSGTAFDKIDDGGERRRRRPSRQATGEIRTPVEHPEQDQQNKPTIADNADQHKRRPGITESRKERLSGSITRTSRNVAVIQVILNLNCETAISEFEHRKRQRRRDRRPPQNQKPKAVQRDPGQEKQALAERADFGLEEADERQRWIAAVTPAPANVPYEKRLQGRKAPRKNAKNR